MRHKEINEHERTSIEMKCLITCLHLEWNVRPAQFSNVWPQWRLVAQRIAQIVEACFGEGGKPRWAGVHHYEGRTSAMDSIDPNLRAAVAKKTREELDLENLRGNSQG